MRLRSLDPSWLVYLPKPLPDYPNYRELAGDVRYKLITARQLLSHISGFANFRGLEEDRKLKIHFEPGTRYAYSGEGLLLLQLVVEAITGKPLEALMQEHVFRPSTVSMSDMAIFRQKDFTLALCRAIMP